MKILLLNIPLNKNRMQDVKQYFVTSFLFVHFLGIQYIVTNPSDFKHFIGYVSRTWCGLHFRTICRYLIIFSRTFRKFNQARWPLELLHITLHVGKAKMVPTSTRIDCFIYLQNVWPAFRQGLPIAPMSGIENQTDTLSPNQILHQDLAFHWESSQYIQMSNQQQENIIGARAWTDNWHFLYGIILPCIAEENFKCANWSKPGRRDTCCGGFNFWSSIVNIY